MKPKCNCHPVRGIHAVFCPVNPRNQCDCNPQAGNVCPNCGNHQPGTVQHTLADLARTVRTLWAEACKHDGIPPTSKFVVFSNDNPQAVAYNEAMGRFMDALKAGAQ